MKKIISAILLGTFLLSFSLTSFAGVNLYGDYIFSDGEYIYTFGNVDGEFDEVGVKINGESYKLEDSKLNIAKITGKFGIGIKDSSNLLGSTYSAVPYTKSGESVVEGAAIEVVKEASVRNIKYHGPESETLDTKPVLMDSFITGSVIYTPTVYVADNVKPEVKQDQYILSFNPHSAPQNVKSEWMSGVKNWISFDLYESATVKVYTKGAFASMLEDKYGFTDNTLENSGSYFTMKHVEYPNAAQEGFDHMYTKHIDASKGAVTVAVPNIGGYGGINRMGYVIAIDYDNEEEVNAEITDVKYAGGVGNVNVSLVHSFEEGSPLYTNYEVYAAKNVHSSLAGNPCIISDNPIAGTMDASVKSLWQGAATDWITFKINKCATIKILTDGDSLVYGNAGFKKSSESATWVELLNKDWPNAERTKRTVLYEKTVDVPKNGETVTVAIPNAPWTSNKWGHIVVVDFDDEYVAPALPEIVPEVSNVLYIGPEGEGYTVEAGESLAVGNKAYTNYELVFGNVEASMLGKNYIIMGSPNKSDVPQAIKNGWDGGSRDWISFEINKSARIKVITDGDTLKHCAKYGFNKSGDSVESYISTAQPTGDAHKNFSVMYYQDVEVPYGEKVTVKIPNAPTWTGSLKWGHFVVIDFDGYVGQ